MKFILKIKLQGILALCEFHYCDFSNNSINIWLMRFGGAIYFISLVRFWGQKYPNIWLMRIFSRTKSRIRQELSVVFFFNCCLLLSFSRGEKFSARHSKRKVADEKTPGPGRRQQFLRITIILEDSNKPLAILVLWGLYILDFYPPKSCFRILISI